MIKKEKVFNFLKHSKMKKSILVFSLAFTFALFTIQSIAQSQTQGASAPEALNIEIHITSAETGCPTTGTVDGAIVTGNPWWPAVPQNYNGPATYILYVPNCSTWGGMAYGWAETDKVGSPGNGWMWCEGSGQDSFSFYIGNDLDPIVFGMHKEYDPFNEE